jgi:hypothetical protein
MVNMWISSAYVFKYKLFAILLVIQKILFYIYWKYFNRYCLDDYKMFKFLSSNF